MLVLNTCTLVRQIPLLLHLLPDIANDFFLLILIFNRITYICGKLLAAEMSAHSYRIQIHDTDCTELN